jgi:hypothetical protein
MWGVSACSGVAAGGGATLGVVLVGNTTTAVVASVFFATTGLVGGAVFIGVGGCFADRGRESCSSRSASGEAEGRSGSSRGLLRRSVMSWK